jgi:transposase-like protein
MNSKPLARAESREVRITFRLTATEAARLRARAAFLDIELSRLIRKRLSIAERIEEVLPSSEAASA